MVIFIGGIHGSGKGTLCKKISSQTGIPHYTASELLNWNEVSPDVKNKKVIDIPDTQNRLINGLKEIKKKHQSFLLDGHFCLFNKNGIVEKIESEIFKNINPNFIVFVSSSPEEVQKRLKTRDGKIYSIALLQEMQMVEESHAKEIAFSLDIPYFHLTHEILPDLINLIIKT